MPNYTFKCSCGKEEERNTSLSVRIIKCPECGGFMDRQFPRPNFTIHGYSYENEYKEKK